MKAFSLKFVLCFSVALGGGNVVANANGDVIPLRPSLGKDKPALYLKIIPQKQCLAIVEALQQPSKIIAEGLAALSKVAALPSIPPLCATEIFDSLQLISVKEVDSPKDWAVVHAKRRALAAEVSQLEESLKCAPAATEPAVSVKPLKVKPKCSQQLSEEQVSLQKNLLERAQEELFHESAVVGFPSDFATALETSFRPRLQEELTKIGRLKRCDPDAAAALPPECGGKTYTGNQLVLLKLAEKNAFKQDYALAEAQGRFFQTLLRERPDHPLAKKAFQLRCFSSYVRKDLAPRLVGRCGGKLIDEGTSKAEFAEVLRRELSNFQDDFRNWQANEAKEIAAIQKVFMNRNADYLENYAIKRLLSALAADSMSKNPKRADEFCHEYEQEQQLTRRFAETNAEGLGSLTPQQWREARSTGLLEAGRAAILMYTGDHFTQINPHIWQSAADGTPLPEAEKIFVETLNRALALLPEYRGQALRRFSDLPAGLLAAHQPGAIVEYQAFTSTSLKPDWRWHASHSFLIYPGKRAREVDSLSASKGEGEVLFQSGTKFKVLSRRPRDGSPDKYDFVLAEVDDEGRVLADLPEKP